MRLYTATESGLRTRSLNWLGEVTDITGKTRLDRSAAGNHIRVADNRLPQFEQFLPGRCFSGAITEVCKLRNCDCRQNAKNNNNNDQFNQG